MGGSSPSCGRPGGPFTTTRTSWAATGPAHRPSSAQELQPVVARQTEETRPTHPLSPSRGHLGSRTAALMYGSSRIGNQQPRLERLVAGASPLPASQPRAEASASPWAGAGGGKSMPLLSFPFPGAELPRRRERLPLALESSSSSHPTRPLLLPQECRLPRATPGSDAACGGPGLLRYCGGTGAIRMNALYHRPKRHTSSLTPNPSHPPQGRGLNHPVSKSHPDNSPLCALPWEAVLAVGVVSPPPPCPAPLGEDIATHR